MSDLTTWGDLVGKMEDEAKAQAALLARVINDLLARVGKLEFDAAPSQPGWGSEPELLRRVVIESPFAGDHELHTRYARAALLDSLGRGEAPLVSHLLYTQALDDDKPAQRSKGMQAGWAWLEVADAVVVYQDLGGSDGMLAATQRAEAAGIPVEFRMVPGWEA